MAWDINSGTAEKRSAPANLAEDKEPTIFFKNVEFWIKGVVERDMPELLLRAEVVINRC